MADKTTGGLTAVPEATIGGLPSIADLYDDTLLPVEQQGEARRMTGAQWKRYAQASTAAYVDGARAAAEQAAGSAAAAAANAENAANSAAAAAGSAQTAQQYSGKPPIIQDGRWWTWNAAAQKYVDTGEAARGNVMYATFYVAVVTGVLYMVTDDEYAGPQFRLSGADLEVVLNHG